MASSLATKRLQREYTALRRNPIENIVAKPLEENILEWHYVIRGTEEPYSGGFYHGVLRFPTEYPLRPPSVLMLTPSGRFKTNRRLCLSMSDFHPESWNPMWSVSTILTGLYSFMLENQPTLGSMEATPAQRRKLASQSLAFNCNDAKFRNLFTDLVEFHQEKLRQAAKEEAEEELRRAKATEDATFNGTSTSPNDTADGNLRHQHKNGSLLNGKNGTALCTDRLSDTNFSNTAENGENADGNVFTFIACVGATVAIAILIVYSHFSVSSSSSPSSSPDL